MNQHFEDLIKFIFPLMVSSANLIFVVLAVIFLAKGLGVQSFLLFLLYPVGLVNSILIFVFLNWMGDVIAEKYRRISDPNQ